MTPSRLFLAAVATLAFAAPALAHEDMRVIGTISKQSATLIEVKTKDGAISKVSIDGNTAILQDKTKADASILKVGANVVVDGAGDTVTELQGISIRVVPAK